ncbi:MAG: septum formation family protein [Actinomycetota bacterium]|nr:septum formation family protein [Actinomycetota bacterium]
MADDNAPGEQVTKKGRPVRKVAPKKVAAKKVAAKKVAAKKVAAKKAVAKKAVPAKRSRPTKKASPVPAREEALPDPVPMAEVALPPSPLPEPPAEPPLPSPPPPEVPEPARQEKRKRKKFRVALLVVLTVALLAGGIVLIADLLSSSDDGVGYTSLKAGNCFNNPPDNFKRVATVSCARPHDLEVVAVVSDPSPKKAGYPGTSALVQVASEQCAPAFQAYVGVPVEQSQLRQVEVVPQKASWDDGGRRLVCTVRSPDGAPSTGSARGSNR